MTQPTNKSIEEYVEDFIFRFGYGHTNHSSGKAVFVEDLNTKEKTDWLRKSLTEIAQQSKKEERERMAVGLKPLTEYQGTEEMHENSEKEYGLEPNEAIEMAYDNLRNAIESIYKYLSNPPKT